VNRASSDPALSQRTSGLSAIARLAPGATIAQVEAEGTAAARRVPVTASTRLLFGNGGPPVVHARPLIADVTHDVKPALLVLAAAVGCVLLIACANIANLFLSRGVARQRELAVRAAIGAGRGRLARQLLTESFILSAGGGLLGLALAIWLVQVAVVFAPARFPRLDDVHVDGRAMAFTALASIVTALASGLVPALRGARFDVAASLHGGDGAIAGGFRSLRARRMRDGLLVAESAFAAMLLVGAALLARSFARLVSVDAGYTADCVLTARVVMPRDASPERTAQFVAGTVAALRAAPGVRAAGAGSVMLLASASAVTTLNLPAGAGGAAPTQARALTYTITPGYAEALGLRLRDGRFFTDRDASAGRRPMIVSEQFSRRYLSGATAAPVVGRRLPGLYPTENVITEIVGVVGTVLKDGNDRQPEPEVYFVQGSSTRRISGSVNVVLRTSGDPAAFAAQLRRIVREVDRAVVVERVEPLPRPIVGVDGAAAIRDQRARHLCHRRARACVGWTVRRPVVRGVAAAPRVGRACRARRHALGPRDAGRARGIGGDCRRPRARPGRSCRAHPCDAKPALRRHGARPVVIRRRAGTAHADRARSLPAPRASRRRDRSGRGAANRMIRA
jgi:predicted permease